MLKTIILTNKPMDFLGQAIKVFLKERANNKDGFYFKVTGSGQTHMDGHDDEGMALRIEVEDIDFVVGGVN